MVDREAAPERRTLLGRALKRHLARLRRKVAALRGDLAEAQRADEFRKTGETLLAYLRQVPARASRVVLPDPADPSRQLSIELNPAIAPQANAARYFKRSAKAARGLKQVPPRLSAAESEAHALEIVLDRLAALEEGSSDYALRDDPALDGDLEAAAAKLPAGLHVAGIAGKSPGGKPSRAGAGPIGARSGGAAGARAKSDRARSASDRAPSARLQPRRLKSREGWDVLIGRSNEGNDYLTHQLARPEDYWFHVHGAAGSHVVLRRGKGKNEPSKRTVEEVASWTAFYSQARTAGKVSVIVTRKRYVRKPRKGPPGLALCTHEKTVMVRPTEPPDSALADRADLEGED